MRKEKTYTSESEYYKLSDGECCLTNPKVWTRMQRYVRHRIMFCYWINNKQFIDPSDALTEVLIETKDMPNKTSTFLIKRINVAIERLWQAHIKACDPKLFEWNKEYQKEWRRNNKHRIYKTPSVKRQNKKMQKRLREEISEHYILQCVYNNIKTKTGIALTFDEIREKHKDKIEAQRRAIVLNRNYKKVKNILSNIEGKSVVYGLSEFKIVKFSIRRNQDEATIWRSDFGEPFIKPISRMLEFVEELRYA